MKSSKHTAVLCANALLEPLNQWLSSSEQPGVRLLTACHDLTVDLYLAFLVNMFASRSLYVSLKSVILEEKL